MQGLSPKAKKSLAAVVRKFRDGDLSPLIDLAHVQLDGDAPATKWTLSNLVLAYAQTDCIDCRGFRQWQQVGRQVRRGSHGAWILGPRTITVEEDGERVQRLRGFVGICVHPITNTDGDDVDALTYEPADLPPLADVAATLGIRITYEPLTRALGSCRPDGTRIRLATHETKVFFHELAHAIHARIDGPLKGGQHVDQETIAEFTACVLMHLYDLGDLTGNAWRYIQSYADDPLQAITRAIGTVEQVIGVIEATAA